MLTAHPAKELPHVASHVARRLLPPRVLCPLVVVASVLLAACEMAADEDEAVADLSEHALLAEGPASSSLTKMRPPPPPGDGPTIATGYMYARGYANRGSTPANGAYAIMSAHAPSLGSPAARHSLGELAVTDFNNRQIVEVGWRVSSDVPRLFVFYWVDGEGQCYNIGCGFVPTPFGEQYIGSPLSVGARYHFEIVHSGNRWLVYFGPVGNPGFITLIGHYPDSLWNNTFTSADALQVFGEVATDQFGLHQQMGDGTFPTATTGARASSVSFVPSSSAGGPPVNLFVDETTPGFYKGLKTSATSMRYGGPGFVQIPH